MKKMPKLTMEQIKKFDYIIFFIAGIIGIVFLFGALCGFIYDLIPHRSRAPAHIEIIQNDEKTEIVKTTNFFAKLKDAYVFTITSNGLKADELADFDISNFEGAGYAQNSLKKSAADTEIINFIFIKDGEETQLFSSDLFIYKYRLADGDNENYKAKQNFNTYAVIKADTNKDNKLDSKDNISLYVSDYDGKNLLEISASIYYFEFTDSDMILFAEYDGETVSYYEFDLNSKSKKLIKSIKKPVLEKHINLNGNRLIY
ncbi:MAG: hypothetical protein MJ159_00240 [Treponemataceae bacterium]|nr:hypothetical protein [Treponemataceae bacterium]